MKGIVKNWFLMFNTKKRNLIKIVNYYRKTRQTRLYTSVSIRNNSSFYFDPVLGIHVFPIGMNNVEGLFLIKAWERKKSPRAKISQLDIFDFILKFKIDSAKKLGKFKAEFPITHKIQMEDIALKVEFLWERELEIATGIRLGRINPGFSNERHILNVLKLI